MTLNINKKLVRCITVSGTPFTLFFRSTPSSVFEDIEKLLFIFTEEGVWVRKEEEYGSDILMADEYCLEDITDGLDGAGYLLCSDDYLTNLLDSFKLYETYNEKPID